ncbi:MAG: glycosyltransferase family 4 protein [Candidatus Methylacidiphilales bacterium]|nr:glycosyltransferase family 4 protein [Candidatus Methylacidiphilales bacterium]
MRITIATGPCFPAPPVRGGGMIRTWMSLAAFFAADGHGVTLFSRAFPGQTAVESTGGFQIVRWGGYDQPRWVGASLLYDLVYAVRATPRLPDADILVTNDFWLPVIAPLFRSAAGRVVVSVNRYPKHQLSLYRRADLLIVPTRSIAHAVEKQQPLWVPRTCCIPNPFDETLFHPDTSVVRQPRHILYVGRLHPEKGLELLLEAFRLLHGNVPGLQLTIAGPHAIAEGGGGERFLNRLQSMAQGLPVVLPGAVHEGGRLAQLYQSHGVFCYPSLADTGEAMGIAPLEAMACGCVPVVSSNPVFSDWLRSGANGWSFNHHGPKPAEALAGRLHDCLVDEKRLEEMSLSAIRTAERFKGRQVANEFMDVFESLLDETR